MQAAIPKLKRRIAELEQFKPDTLRDRSDPQVKVLETDIEGTLVDIFNNDTAEYHRYRRAADLDRGPHNMNGVPAHEILAGFEQGKAEALALLGQIIKSFDEKLEDAGETASGRALSAYAGLDLHPEIEGAAGQLYRDGHYANAIVDAVKALNGLVRVRSGRDDLDGTTLMQQVFSPKNPNDPERALEFIAFISLLAKLLSGTKKGPAPVQ